MPVRLKVFLQFSFSSMVCMFYYIIHVVSFVQETLEKRLTSCQNVWFCYCMEINIVIYVLYTNNVFVVDEQSRGWGIVSFCMPRGGE